LPRGSFEAKSKCDGTIEDHRAIALDVRELTRQHVFDHRVGTVFHLNLRFPWLRMMRLSAASLDLQLASGRTIIVPVVWAACGYMGQPRRLQCPLCGRRVCLLYHLDERIACQRCQRLWYAAQRKSSSGRKVMTKRKIRRKLGDYGQHWATHYPPKPRGMWRQTYDRHCAALDRIERKPRTRRESNIRNCNARRRTRGA